MGVGQDDIVGVQQAEAEEVGLEELGGRFHDLW